MFGSIAPSILTSLTHPLAIAMWDFSWLERRWTGAGYEDWGLALDELKERGYDAVRIDAYPHLLLADTEKTWEIEPVWNTQDWGAPARVAVRVHPELVQFIAACAERGLKVGLSTWFRRDVDNVRVHLTTPERHAAAWRRTLDLVSAAGLLPHILYVDFCNEWTHPDWAPIFFNRPPHGQGDWDSPGSLDWMRRAIAALRPHYPNLPLTFSTNTKVKSLGEADVSFMDFLEPHMWLSSGNTGDFYARVGYRFELFSPVGYENLARFGEKVYRADPAHWHGLLTALINLAADGSRRAQRPLVTTEGWSSVDYKDGPGLDWGWVKEGCVVGTEAALATGRWAALCTSNFCGPQFRGMWRDVEWHRRLTAAIHRAPLPKAS
jgi:Sugar-binding cellulase-like